MARRKLSAVKLEQLCRMQSEAVLSAETMAERLCTSVPAVQSCLADPQVQQRVAELDQEHKDAGRRLAFSRARWAVGHCGREDAVGLNSVWPDHTTGGACAVGEGRLRLCGPET